MYVEYTLCKQLLRVSGAVPDRPDSEEELTESESEECSEPEIVVKVPWLPLLVNFHVEFGQTSENLQEIISQFENLVMSSQLPLLNFLTPGEARVGYSRVGPELSDEYWSGGALNPPDRHTPLTNTEQCGGYSCIGG